MQIIYLHKINNNRDMQLLRYTPVYDMLCYVTICYDIE